MKCINAISVNKIYVQYVRINMIKNIVLLIMTKKISYVKNIMSNFIPIVKIVKKIFVFYVKTKSIMGIILFLMGKFYLMKKKLKIN